MALSKCPFMGGGDCMAADCALWVQERILQSDFQTAGSRWQDREIILPAHCSMNKEQAEMKTFARIANEGKMEEESSGQESAAKAGAEAETNWYRSVYER